MGSKAQNRLVVFDVEGILIPKMRFILFEVAGRMGLWLFAKSAFIGLLYEIGLIPLKKALVNLYGTFRGLPLERFVLLFEQVPLMPGVENAFHEIKKAGFKTALISSGIPRVALEKLGLRLGAEYVSGLEIGLSDGCLTGAIWGNVIEPHGKATALKQILSDTTLSPCYCVGVADDRNNLPMFELCDLRIGYNPDFILSRKSDHIVKGDITGIIPIVKAEQVEDSLHRLTESGMIREAIHLGGFFIPFACISLVSRQLVSFLAFLVTALYMVSETARMFGAGLPVIKDITLKAAGKAESQEFVAAPVFYALGVITSLMLFPEPIGYVSIIVLTLGDGLAAVLGQQFGSRRIPFNKVKNFEGTIGGFIAAFLGSLLFVDPLRALVATAVGMVAEVLPLPLSDNLTVPWASGAALILASAISI